MPSQTIGTANVTSNHDKTTAGKPAEDMPDTYSLVDATEKVVDTQKVDENLPMNQRNAVLEYLIIARAFIQVENFRLC